MDINPTYDIDSAELKKFRFMARDGLRELHYLERQAYGAAVEKAVLAKQRSQLKGHAEIMPTPVCASGTWHTTGDAIDKAIRGQHRASLAACPAQVRRAREPEQWQSMYADAMRACGKVPS